MGHSFTGGGDGANGQSGHGHGGSGHGSHGHQAMGGHPDQGAIWNSALQGVGGKGKPLTKVPARTFLPIIVAIVAFLAMLIPFAINWDEVEAVRQEEELKARQEAGQGTVPNGQIPGQIPGQAAQQAYGQIPGQTEYGQMPGQQQYMQGNQMPGQMPGQMPNQAMMPPTAGQLATQPYMQTPASPMANYPNAAGQAYGQPAYAPGQYYGQQPYAAPYDASGQLSALSGHSNRLESSGHMSPHNHLAQPKFKVYVAR